ncbi:gliding motility-associated C-terminal domain-containing protein [Flavobacterium sp. FlaQc-57]|uniref:gliding motility-associated C-terminal domain-containing protein n=1 Tax=Flavobacterium sp. FlaQc-57 TaxID=3374186 RepID=UPI0037573E44
MKNRKLYKTAKSSGLVSLRRNNSGWVISMIISMFICQESNAQVVNQGDIKINDGTLMSVYFDYQNKVGGNFINDGEVYIFENWNNEGIISYTNSANGTTLFTGTTEQIIEGTHQSDFQNIVFNNKSSTVPFHLATIISVGKMADFTKGIINADTYNGLMIFNENAFHKNVSSQSFVDGRVENNVDQPFQFPIGDALFFRPTLYTSNSADKTAYTSQYFYKSASNPYPFESKDESIITINNAEYWTVTQEKGTEKIILSLTLDANTTPAAFFESDPETELAIVRWDAVAAKWVNEGGILSEPVFGEAYSNLLTGEVGGYGTFTMAIVKKEVVPTDDLIVYNAISPNGDGINDTFHIKGINKYPNNTVEVYNRWGVKVYEAKSYNESDVMFSGYSDGRATVNRTDKLPTGTYFYTLKYNNNNGKTEKKAGYLYLNNQ